MEIDENSQIIALVQSRPILYSKCIDFRERTHQWKEIADILKVDVSWIKSRWHILRAKFLNEYSGELKGKASNFKYFNEMSFLASHVNVNAFDMYRKSNELEQAEFVITQRDLEETSDDDSSNIFVELDIENNSNKDLSQAFDLSAEITDDDVEDAFCTQSTEFNEGKPEIAQTRNKPNSHSQVQTFHIIRNENNPKDVLKDDTRNEERQSIVTETASMEIEKCVDFAAVERKPPTDTSSSEQPELEQIEKAMVQKDRCEDTIFGELVTATLRKMQSEKKKAVKREIMNILFT